ncbi:hypothetical protein FDUTEX481_03341 [Tolypothrix sp. PCC 7601]|nr:hypothetical protein FDUTEX481_03341 [Tolypothrix sp. PCC 7601]BAZ71999.1 hypothetical protein NIES50_05480 [Aulosira laxa NIES-50]
MNALMLIGINFRQTQSANGNMSFLATDYLIFATGGLAGKRMPITLRKMIFL